MFIIIVIVDPNFNSKLDDISEHYRQAGVCSGEDCHRLMIEVSVYLLLLGHASGLALLLMLSNASLHVTLLRRPVILC